MNVRNTLRGLIGLPLVTETVIDVLTREHGEVDALFEAVRNAAPSARKRIFADLRIALGSHAIAEQTVVYPVFGDGEVTRALVLEAFEEHAIVRQLLDELARAGPADETWMAKLAVLQENVTNHVREEEHELFPHARLAIGPLRLQELAVEYTAARKRQLTKMKAGPPKPARTGRPATPRKPPATPRKPAARPRKRAEAKRKG